MILFNNMIIGQEVLTKWKTAKKSKDIKISYRFVEVGDTLKTRQMRISFLIDVEPEKIIKLLKEPQKGETWFSGTEKFQLLEDNENNWTTYNLYKNIWPFEQNDIITNYYMIKSNSSITLLMTGNPNFSPRLKNINRLKNYEGRWVFRPLENGRTKVEFYTIAFTKPILPRFIQDPIIQKIFIDSINKLRDLATYQV